MFMRTNPTFSKLHKDHSAHGIDSFPNVYQ